MSLALSGMHLCDWCWPFTRCLTACSYTTFRLVVKQPVLTLPLFLQ